MLTGQRFGKLVVLRRDKNDIRNKACWRCRCDCGRKTTVGGSSLRTGNTKTCGVCSRPSTRLVNLTGQRFGKLLVLRQHGRNHRGQASWLCQCDCGKQKVVVGSQLREPRPGKYRTGSCGCSQFNLRVPPSKYVWFNYRCCAQRTGRAFELSPEELAKIISKDCAYCGKPPSLPLNRHQVRKHPDSRKFRYNGIDRIDNEKGYVKGNLAPCCVACGEMKSDKTLEAFLSQVEAIHAHQAGKP